MKFGRWQFMFGVVLLIISALVYFVQFLILGGLARPFSTCCRTWPSCLSRYSSSHSY